MRISDWSSDVCSSDLAEQLLGHPPQSLVGQSAMIMHEPAEVERRAEELSRQTGLRIPANFQVIVASGSHATADEREWTYVHRDGSRVPVKLAITPMADAKIGRPSCKARVVQYV